MAQGVFVLGMHRSGTSAVTRLVNLLGPAVADAADLLIPKFDNPTGHWESWSLMTLDERLLGEFGADWASPPVLEAGWQRAPALDPLRREAAELFHRLHPTEPWVFKDPRNCILLPFWQEVLGAEGPIVLVHRNPIEVAASLAERDRLDVEYALALWERYARSALRVAAGVPVLAVRYETILDDAVGWTRAARESLARWGIPVRPVPEREVREFVDPGLRHAAVPDDELRSRPGASAAQLALLDALGQIEGAHERFEPPALPPETSETEALLAARRHAAPV